MGSPSPLSRLKQVQRGRWEATEFDGNGRAAQHYAAATSDADNAAYLERLNLAFGSCGGGGGGGGGHGVGAVAAQSVAGPCNRYDGVPVAAAAAAANAAGAAARVAALQQRLHAKEQTSPRQQPQQPQSHPAVSQQQQQQQGAPSLAAHWRRGPDDPSGTLLRLSDRPLLCSAADWKSGSIVLGGADHAAYVIDVASGKLRRTLFLRNRGHTEWVTSASCLPGGCVVTGGMDGRLWLWPPTGGLAAAVEVPQAHNGPVSRLRALDSSSSSSSGGSGGGRSTLLASGSYDGTTKIWALSGRQAHAAACLVGHGAAVLELEQQPPLGCGGDGSGSGGALLTGDRKGGLACFDVPSGKRMWGSASAHAGHVTALAWGGGVSDSCSGGILALSGGQDGVLRAWDGRAARPVTERALHVGSAGRGALTGIAAGGSVAGAVVTVGADCTLRVLDPAAGYAPRVVLTLPDFPYVLRALGGIAAVGCGDGSVCIADVSAGTLLYALGAGKAAVRALEMAPGKLIAAGDDGTALTYSFG